MRRPLIVLTAILITPMILQAGSASWGGDPETPGPVGQSPVSLSAWGSATMDGVLSPGEWDSTRRVEFDVALSATVSTTARLYVMNDMTNMYVAVAIRRSGLAMAQAVLEFDNDYDGFREDGDDVFLYGTDGEFVDDYRAFPEGDGFMDDWSGGTKDGGGFAGDDGEWTVLEFFHPLNSTDDGHDFNLCLGSTVGFAAMVLVRTDPQAATLQTHFPTGFWDPAGYGAIQIAFPSPDDIRQSIERLPDSAFDRNPAQRTRVLSQKLGEVDSLISQGRYQEAIDKLRNDVRAKMDGCAGGNPQNDWITDCAAQQQLLAEINALMAYLTSLL